MSESMPPAPAAPDKDPYLGAVINDHITLARLLGVGGQGRVYATEKDPRHPARAVKLLNTDLVYIPQIVAGFEREARIMMELQHPNVVQIFEFGTAAHAPFNGALYVVMALIRGKTLEDMMQERRDAGIPGRLPAEEVGRFMLQACAPLMDAHEKGIIHCDVKPQNVFVETSPGVTIVKLTDFGISRFQNRAEGKITQSDNPFVLGTPNYMAPEQVLRDPMMTTKVDVYALGVMTFELLTGRLPIEVATNDTVQSYLLRVVSEPPMVLKDVMPGVDRSLNEIVMACLEKEAHRRPTVREFRDGLASAIGPRINSSFSLRPSLNPEEVPTLQRVDMTPRGVPLDVVPVADAAGAAVLPATRRIGADPPNTGNPELLDIGKTTEYVRPPAQRQPLNGTLVWVATLLGVAGLGWLVGGVAHYAWQTSAPAVAERPRPFRSVDAGSAPAADAGTTRVDAAVRRVPPPDPQAAEASAHGAACMSALASRTRPDGWQARCRAYTAARCPATGSRAVDCDLIETVLRRAAPRPRPPRVEDEDDEEDVEEDSSEPTP